MIRRSLLLAATALVTACTDPNVALKPFSGEPVRGASVGTISVVNGSGRVTPEEANQLQAELLGQSARCATGTTRYDMIVEIHDFHPVRADVRVVDPARNEMVAAYYVEASRVPAFAQRVCRNVFAG
jgi:hypothetical protein